MKTVSVLMPCYNNGATIEEAVASAEKQTWPSVEIIVVDDGSTDAETLEALDRLRQAGRCAVICQENRGPGAARNRAFEASRGDYVLPLDADDRIAPEYVERAVALLEAHPQAGACYCRAALFGEAEGEWKLPAFSVGEMLIDNVVFVTALMRREAYAQVGGFDEGMREGLEDYDFFLSLLEAGWEIRQLTETLFFYRIKGASRNHRLADSGEVIGAVNRRIFEKHRAFYAAHVDELLEAARARKAAYHAADDEVQYWRFAIGDKSPKGMARLFLLRRGKLRPPKHETRK